ncbi:MAG: ABC transporter permease [Deltaproteobacteria bacterium]|nr:MAG: ABC transporter permease [Deltaproteobacteria bacterium]
MDYLYESLITAITLIFNLDVEVRTAVWTSLYTSSTAILFASLVGIPIGLWLGLSRFRGRRILVTLLNTLMALPTVVIGLLLFGLLSRQGPLGSWGLLFTPVAMILGQVVLATPIVANLVLAAVTGADRRILPTLLTLGASPFQATLQLLKEIRFGIMAAIIAGFGRVIAEVGVAMMLGGNIRGVTRTMTTAIALETSKGEFAFGLSLGIILLAVALMVNLGLNFAQQR